MDFRIISIGCMPAHPLWNERSAVRTGHATTTLVTSGKRRILVDPGLPPQVLAARLNERAGISPQDITDVFLTSFAPDVRRGLALFDGATWHISETEREVVGVNLATALKDLLTRREDQGGVAKDESLREVLEHDVALLAKCKPAPDSLADRIDLFPLPGVSPGLCGLLLSHTRHTVLICGDAIPTSEHIEQGKSPSPVPDLAAAKSSFEEALEIADLLILGRDNIVVNPTKRPF
ncbi:MAG: MBL fold metallo-hydrolase [Phycisphaerae bacterium]|jgi:glyoxylase-like metal-dependent hydrolase (beta-lactamase superfamily II)